ncbi:PepSY-like domain-containing protein [Catalinimonas niigatensis]|uniref:PepSY-like domain-containing protein n=1 Tax=Catalinimonas niigatensis TaxID=1397264 RepID=UPI002665B70B|nr:PepSY-like domain-containing protein [Catalinimonas niigatensis]WPP51375.1 PepSY-like domain-containing protein [Catalinimonas niigatensis]
MKNLMHRKPFAMLLTFLSAMVILSACEKESVVPEGKLPDDAQGFISLHFPDQSISQVIKDRDGLSVDYEVILENGVQLEFNRKGECSSIEGNTELPDSVIPEKILEYVNQSYADNFIISWERDDNEQEVMIDNGTELKFDKSSNFLRIDY